MKSVRHGPLARLVGPFSVCLGRVLLKIRRVRAAAQDGKKKARSAV
jgi:hypothetical protein